jgi:hypothetical protein
MSKHLTKSEIKQLIEGLYELLECREKIVEKNADLLKRIHEPSVPGILGESIVFHLIKDNEILSELKDITMIELPSSGPDLRILLKDGKEIGIQVKTTRKSGGVRISTNDVKYDYLIWVDLGQYFPGRTNDVIYVSNLKNPTYVFKDVERKTGKKETDKNWHYPRFVSINKQKPIDIHLDDFLRE